MENNQVKKVKIGSQGLIASVQGLGTMGMTAFYKNDEVSEDEKINSIGRALELGINFLDTANIYMNFETGDHNEALVAKAIKKYGRENFVIATKTGIDITSQGFVANGKPEFIRKQCEDSLKRLDTTYIDLFYLHRIDRTFPLVESMKCLKDLISEGKIKYVGLSECSAEELKIAHQICSVSAIQMEWSLQTRDIEKTIVPTARELGVGIVAYSPLGRGFLSRTFVKREEIKDWRASCPRFNEENFDENALAAQKLEEWSAKKGYSAAQIALAWLHNQGNDVIPIPGTKSSKRIEENSKAAHIKLTDEEMREIESMIPEPKGLRYDESLMKATYLSGI